MFLEPWERSTTYKSAQTVRHYADLAQTIAWAILRNVIINLLGKSHTHLFNVALGMVLVCLRHQKHDFREHQRNVVSDDLHVLRVTLVSMDKDPQMNTVLVELSWCLFETTIEVLFVFFLLGKCLLLQFCHIFDKAFFKDYWLQIL